MDFLTIKEQKILTKLLEINSEQIDFKLYRKSGVADRVGVSSSNLSKYLKILQEKGYINYENNCITYNQGE